MSIAALAVATPSHLALVLATLVAGLAGLLGAVAALSKAQAQRAEVVSLLKARNACLWVTSPEEVRVERALAEAGATAGYVVAYWDCVTGITDSAGREYGPGIRMQEPGKALGWLRSLSGQRLVLVMRDLQEWLRDPVLRRTIRNLSRDLKAAPRDSARAMVVLSPTPEVPADLKACSTVLEWSRPDRDELQGIYDDVVASLPDAMRSKMDGNGKRDAAVSAALGLTADGAQDCYARSLVDTRDMNPKRIAAAKRALVEQEGSLQWIDPDPRGLDGVGGCDALKSWCLLRKRLWGAKARAFGLPAPKGVFLVGLPGTGKSLAAKCIGTAFALPCIRFDVNGTQSKYVGESGQNIRRVLSLVDALGPCVLWVDEIDKALAGGSGPQGDGGVAADMLGALLSWMQEHEGGAFVIATANTVDGLPPELLRRGRFDEVFFLDLPQRRDRVEILDVTLRQYNRTADGLDLAAVASATADYTGSEVAAMVPEALLACFADGERNLTTDDLLQAAKVVVPLARLAAERVTVLRTWAQGRARYASTPDNDAPAAGTARDLDL